MTRAQDMKRLAEEIGNAHEERRLFGQMLEKERREMKKSNAGFMGALADDRREMNRALQDGLVLFKEGVEAGEKSRRKGAAASKGQRKEEIARRKARVAQAKKSTRELLKGFDDAHAEMIGELKKEMQRMRSAMAAFGESFQIEVRDAQSRRGDERAACRADIQENRQITRAFLEEVQGRLREIEASCRERRDAVREGLAQFMSDLSTGEQKREAGAREELMTRIESINAIKDQAAHLRNELQQFLVQVGKGQKRAGTVLRALLSEYAAELKGAEKDRKEKVGVFLAELQTESRDVAAAWRSLLAAMASGGGEAASQVPEKAFSPPAEAEPETAAEAEFEAVAEAEGDSSIRVDFDPEQLKPKIVGILKDAPDGMKMAQIAESLHIEQWRKLIPVMRDIQDSGQVRKEGPFYYSE